MAAASTRLTGAIHAVRRGTARALGAAAAPQPASTQVSQQAASAWRGLEAGWRALFAAQRLQAAGVRARPGLCAPSVTDFFFSLSNT